MYMAGVNFALHFRAVTGHLDYFKDHEWRFFTTLLLGAAGVLLVLNLAGGAYAFTPSGVEHAFRDGLFQATSIGTTTGFVTTDYELWVPAAQMVIFILFFTGGMAGSTGGSMKSVRVLLLLKQTATEIRKHLHPRAVLLARVGRRAVKEDVLANVLGFVLLYGLLFVAGAMALALLGIDFVTALGASAATVGNIGPGLGGVGPTDNYGWMSQPALGVMSFLMLVGRLEIYTVLLLFHPETWKRR
jgi:trk system potassium uptake protein TrkH